MPRSIKVTTTGLILTLLCAFTAHSRQALNPIDGKLGRNTKAASPNHCFVGHRVGKIELGVSNNGSMGRGYALSLTDCFTGETVPSCEYPSGSNVNYMYGTAFWIGAVVGRDTLVSVGADGWSVGIGEFYPDEAPFGEIIHRSIIDPESPDYEGAVSEEDYIATYTDTITDGVPPDYFGRPHRPLHIEVTQRSYAWSYAYAEDFILFDYSIKNIGIQQLEKVYMGIYVDGDVGFNCYNDENNCAQDDVCGFVRDIPSPYGCGFVDTVNIAWIADNDGDLNRGAEIRPAPNVTGARIVRTPSDRSPTDTLNISFNWWIGNVASAKDFGPRQRNHNRDYRTGGTGTPEGDVNKYWVLSNGEFDYDQVFTASIQPTDTLWSYPPPDYSPDWSDGMDTRYLLSFGPFDISAGQTLPISFAYVGGEGFHVIDGNISNLPNDPNTYYKNLDFTDFGLNATWASWVYDNPGVDTDNDGDSGKVRYCYLDSTISEIDTISNSPLLTDTLWDYTSVDTVFYEGDGVPDFRGASPPPAPDFWLDPGLGYIKVRFNGLRSETARDVFSRKKDFEGYRIYCGRDPRAASYSVVASYDIDDYNKYVFNPNRPGGSGWELRDVPFTRQELTCLYGASCDDAGFDPLDYSVNSPLRLSGFGDSLFYFEAQDYNASQFGITTDIAKRFPDAPYPSSLVPDSALPEELTEDGYLKYFEYEFTITDLLSTVEYWLNVTAFDYGSPESGLPSLETSVSLGAKSAYAIAVPPDDPSADLNVYIYPNPYRIDDDYRGRGFEGRTEDFRPNDRVRTINFANLPPRCTIRIYTIDGDLVREIEHNMPVSDPKYTHDSWDMITRNTQLVVSGLYYWAIETPDGRTQVGKLVIIM